MRSLQSQLWMQGIALLLFVLPAGIALGQYKPLASGEELFRREWQSNGAGALEGDGLGPLFNARSCVACHHLGGTGGAGGNEHNVDLLSLTGLRGEMTPRRAKRIEMFTRLIHPALVGRTNLVLHKESTNPAYASWRNQLLAFEGSGKLPLFGTDRSVKVTRSAEESVIKIGSQKYRLTHRNTPSLFGAGLIDTIHVDTLIALARDQQRANPKMAGRVAAGGGRFGWRGQVDSLRNFVAGACANELGLETADEPQPLDPQQPGYRNVRVDMGEWEVAALTDYIRQLPPPAALEPSDRNEDLAWQRGRRHFNEAQCSHCHTPHVGHISGIYSDLLLHDMGPSLSDPVPSHSPMSLSSPVVETQMIGGGYSGASVPLVSISEGSVTETETSTRQLWRTPPLWGVRDSAPYLHDGRAATLEEAIEMHDGEAKRSAKHFRQLDAAERNDLLRFVRSLGAPPELIRALKTNSSADAK